jgi:deoxyribodipyrimidine photo-lyase
MMSEQPVIHWFRRDLRLTDNRALFAALQTWQPVITVFVADDRILNGERVGAPRLAFLRAALENLRESIAQRGGRLIVRRGEPAAALRALVDETNASAVYCNRDYTPYAQHRDDETAAALNVLLHRLHDALVLPPGSVLTDGGAPYKVYSPFKRAWRGTLQSAHYTVQTALPGKFHPAENLRSLALDTLFDAAFPVPSASETAAQRQLTDFTASRIYDYKERRNELTVMPFDNGNGGTSQISPYLRLGVLSPRQAFSAGFAAWNAASSKDARASIDTWIDELIWREFYMHVMAHFPHVYSQNFNPMYDNLAWAHDPAGLAAWKNGETGYPVVDAAMRQLQQVGWIPNRVRMIVASFLTKDLLIDWREGERHFMRCLIDGDPAANNGGWQWAAGTGTDAQPYFRIFNPVSQSQKFDPDGAYIRHWLPELAHIHAGEIHEPWKLKQPPSNYPARIVDHKTARERTLTAFKRARDNA